MSDTDVPQREDFLPDNPDEAIRELFVRHHTRVYSICVRLLENNEEAEDITQDVFVKAYKALDSFRGEADPGTGLYRIAVNLSLNRQRRLKRLRWFSLDGLMERSAGPEWIDKAELPGAAVEQTQLEQIVQGAINQLPERQRIALVLSRYEGLSYREIAETMSSSVPSVESLLHRAKQNLSRKLRPYLDDLRT